MENFYFFFEDLDNWDVWNERGYTMGFIILIAISFLITAIYYLYLGRRSMSYSTLGKWFLFCFLNVILVFILTLLVEGFTVFENPGIGDFEYEIWLFTMINSLYAFVLYILLSLLFKRFSIHSKYIPVKI